MHQVQIDKHAYYKMYLNMLRKRLGSWYNVGIVLYKARHANMPANYIDAGLREGWIMNTHIDEDYKPGKVKAWIDEHLFKIKEYKPRKYIKEEDLISIKNILKNY